MSDYGVALFHTTSAAFAAEKALAKAGIECDLIPPPREFSSDCGVAVRFRWDARDETVEIMNAAGVDIAGIHQLL